MIKELEIWKISPKLSLTKWISKEKKAKRIEIVYLNQGSCKNIYLDKYSYVHV